MRTGSWKIAIFGTDTYYAPDNKSEVSFATLGVTDPLTDVNWTVLQIFGGDPVLIQKEQKKRTGGITKNARGMRRGFSFHIMPFEFPADLDLYEKLFEQLDHNYVYIYKGTYDDWSGVTFTIHTDAKAMQCAVTGKTEEKYKDGSRAVILEVVKVMPIVRT
jgi:hypothetical protein